MHPHEKVVRKSTDKFKNSLGEIFCAAVDRSTKATYSLGNRAYYFEGTICTGTKTGEYLTRLLDNETYMVCTRFPYPYCPTLDVVYLTMTNAICKVQREIGKTKNKYGDSVTVWQDYLTEVKCYMDTVNRPLKETLDGLKNETLFIITLPHKFDVQKLDRIITLDEHGQEIAKFKVDSINDVLVVNGNIHDGIDVLQVVDDLRI